METFEPWEDYPDLTLERLTMIAAVIRSARNSSADAFDPEAGDNRWTRGCQAYMRQCNMLRGLKETCDWLSFTSDSRDHLEFTFAVGEVPLKICRGDLEDATPRLTGFSVGEQILIALEYVTRPPAPLRLVVESDNHGYVEKISLVEFDGSVVARYFDIPLDDSGEFTLPTPDPVTPLPIEGIGIEEDERGTASA